MQPLKVGQRIRGKIGETIYYGTIRKIQGNFCYIHWDPYRNPRDRKMWGNHTDAYFMREARFKKRFRPLTWLDEPIPLRWADIWAGFWTDIKIFFGFFWKVLTIEIP